MTSKSKKKIKRLRLKSRKMRKGGSEETKQSETGKKTPEEIMEEVIDERKNKPVQNDTGDGILKQSAELAKDLGANIAKRSITLIDGVALNTLEKSGDLLGVDLTNPEQTQQKLAEIKTNITDPKTQEKVKEILGSAAELGGVAIEATKPFLDPLIETVNEKSKEVLSKAGETGVKVLLNTAEEIPGVGVVLGTIRSASNIGEAITATANATSEVVTTTSDTINAASKNFEQMMKEKENVVNRTQESINKYEDPVKYKTPEPSEVPKRGGTKKKRKGLRFKRKSKRVTFNL
uniref:Uncharacterized protein n=1 Tax=viral metagenome TaxID=1070528 RepID=A0A6C0LN02_9ZZZZ